MLLPLRRRALVLAPVLFLLGLPAAAASETKVAVAPVGLEGDATEQRVDPDLARRELLDRITTTLGSEFALVSVQRCGDTEQLCALAHAREGGADYLVVTTLVADGADQRVRFAIQSTSTGTIVVTFDDVCELCGRAELDTFTTTMVGALVTKLRALEPDATSLTVVGLPAKASVWIDEQRVGALPWQGELAPGEHEVKVARRGYLPTRQKIDVVPGTRERVQVSLDRDPASVSRSLRIAGWTLVGVGAATVGGGAVLWAFDGRPHRDSCAEPDALGRCPNMYSSKAGGIALTTVGLGLTVAGGGILIYEHVRFHRTRWRAAFRPGLRRASVQVWF